MRGTVKAWKFNSIKHIYDAVFSRNVHSHITSIKGPGPIVPFEKCSVWRFIFICSYSYPTWNTEMTQTKTKEVQVCLSSCEIWNFFQLEIFCDISHRLNSYSGSEYAKLFQDIAPNGAISPLVLFPNVKSENFAGRWNQIIIIIIFYRIVVEK